MQNTLPLRKLPSAWWWLAFVAIQALGFMLPYFANVHTNPGPLFVGVLLLLPGSLAAFFLHLDGTSSFLQCALISGVNLLVWYAVWRTRGGRE